MKEHELTDAEFIEVMEAHKKGICRNCFIGKNEDLFLNKRCGLIIPENAIRIFNRQKAEIERLNKLLDDKCDRCIEKDRSNAIKEFAERLKASKIKPEFPWEDFYVTEGMIDDLVKEMTEVKK